VPDPKITIPDFSVSPGPVDMGGTSGDAGGGDMGAAGWRAEKAGATDLRGVWVADAALSAIYAVGHDGTILRRSGAGQFLREESGTTENLYAVAGVSAEDVYAVGQRGVVLHRAGGKWTREVVPVLGRDLLGLAVVGPGEVYVVGDAGTVLHLQGGAWKAEAAPQDADLRGVWAGGAGEAWAVGARVILRRDAGGMWVREKSDNILTELRPLYGIISLGGSLYAAGEYGQVLRRKMDKWEAEATVKPMAGQPPHFYGLYGDRTDLIVVGSGGAVQRGALMADMNKWSTEMSGAPVDLFGVAGAGLGAVYAVGAGGTVVRRQ
jgi:hypothetical protein